MPDLRIPAAALVALVSAHATTPALLAQNLCEGNGTGEPYLQTTPVVIGGSWRVDLGSPLSPNGFAFLSFSTGVGPTVSPFVGPLCLDVTSPLYTALFFLLDGAGNATMTASIPNDPGTFAFAPLFVNAYVSQPVGFGMSKTARLQWEMPDSFDPLAPTVARAMHSATALWDGDRDNRQDVFVAGGAAGTIITPTATADTAVFSPLTRTWTQGPLLSLPRVMHRAVRLLDGRVLVTGGATTANAGTATCDLYDPASNTITAAAPMTTPRMGHGISLLGDGRVLVTGGFADWQNASTQFAARLSTAQDSSEIYDPVSDTWSPGPQMAAARAGHSQTKLSDGRILIAGGVDGGVTTLAGGIQQIQIPTFTDSCELFDATSGQLTAAPALPSVSLQAGLGRGFHAASLLPDGTVLVTGGAASIGSYGAAACTNHCVRFDPAANPPAWTVVGPLLTGVAFHTQTTDPVTGDALVLGGYTGEFGFTPASTQAGFHDGGTFTAVADLGTHQVLTGQAGTARAGHTCVRLQDGTFFVWGGQTPTLGTIVDYDDGYVYVR